MKQLFLLLILILAGCTSKPVKPIEYQNTFWLGCMNAYIHFTVKLGDDLPNSVADQANAWCTAQYESIKSGPMPRKDLK